MQYLGANTWSQRKDGVPLDLLDNLSIEEIKVAEVELIGALSLHDNWPVVGLGHIKSKTSLPTLYNLLEQSSGVMKVTIAHSIFQISEDPAMIDIVLKAVPGIAGEYELIEVLYYLPNFKDKRVMDLLNNYRNHKACLVAYNATRYLGLPTDEVVVKFRDKKKPGSFWDRLFGK